MLYINNENFLILSFNINYGKSAWFWEHLKTTPCQLAVLRVWRGVGRCVILWLGYGSCHGYMCGGKCCTGNGRGWISVGDNWGYSFIPFNFILSRNNFFFHFFFPFTNLSRSYINKSRSFYDSTPVYFRYWFHYIFYIAYIIYIDTSVSFVWHLLQFSPGNFFHTFLIIMMHMRVGT